MTAPQRPAPEPPNPEPPHPERRVRVVLAGPRDGRNVGSVCRAMKTMGLRDLHVVAGDFDPSDARAAAVHAADVFDAAPRPRSLPEAIADCDEAIAVSRRRGKRRKLAPMPLSDLPAHLAARGPGVTALVFGTEATGLRDEEIACCTGMLSIPTHPDFPSLNLSHAAQIVTYELFRARGRHVPARYYEPVALQQVDAALDPLLDLLVGIDFFRQAGPEELRVFLRDVLSRAALAGPECERLQTLFHSLRGIVLHRPQRERETGG